MILNPERTDTDTDKIYYAAQYMRGIAELLDAVFVAMERDPGYDKGIWLLAQIAYSEADVLGYED